MAPLPVWQNNHSWSRLANHVCDPQPVLPGVLDAPVRNVEGPAPARAQNLRRIGCLARPIVGGPARPHLALRQVEDAGALPALRSFQQSAAASLLHVVAMRGDG